MVWSVEQTQDRNDAMFILNSVQAEDAGRQIFDLLQSTPPENVLWVVSPLTRTIQTFLGACPGGHLAADPEHGGQRVNVVFKR